MAQFPANIPTFTDLVAGQTLAVNQHTARHNTVHAELAAAIAKIGINGSADTSSLDYKVAHLQTDTGSLATTVGTLPTVAAMNAAIASAVSAAVAATKDALYPIGSSYTNYTDSTNPGTLLGFGTWVADGVGRVLVGKAGSSTFSIAGDTGGEETHILTTAEMPSHNHTFGNRIMTWDSGQSTGGVDGSGHVQYYPFNSTASMANAGSSNAHNNLQPYKVVYMWQRTA